MAPRLSLLAVVILLATGPAWGRPPSAAVNAKGSSQPQRVLVLDGSPVHNVGNLLMHTGNWGSFGSGPGTGFPFSGAPSAEWPAGSGIEYLFMGGLWVGAIVGGVPSVSTAAYSFEFRPTSDPVDVIYRSVEGTPGGMRYPSPDADDDHDGLVDEDPLDGHDNDGDGLVDEDYAAISQQMFSCWYTDDQPGIEQVYPEHRPLHLMVRENSYQWSYPDYDDFIGYDYEITNTGTQVLENVYVGWFLDTDVGSRSVANYWTDDATAFRMVTCPGCDSLAYDYAYGYDADGDNGTATGDFGVVVLDQPTDPTGQHAPVHVGVSSYAWFRGDAPFEDGGDPTNDFERYEVMSSHAIERDGTAPADYRFVVSVGPFDEIAPGQTVKFSMALVATPHGDLTNVANAVITYRGFEFEGQRVHWWPPVQVQPQEPMTASVRFTPPTINMKSGGPPLLAHVTLPEGYHAADVTSSSLVLGGSLHGTVQTLVSDHEFIARFGRKGLQQMAVASGDMELSLRFVADQQLFVGSGRVRVLHAVGPVLAPGSGTATTRLALSPNPFNPSTRIVFELPREMDLTLEVYSATGALVRRLASGTYPAGRHVVEWNGTGDDGTPAASGVYFCRLRAGAESMVRKMLLVK